MATRGHPSTDHLALWIDELRARLDRDEFAALAPIDLGYGTRVLPAERTIEIMLSDLDDLDDQGGTWNGDDHAWRARRKALLLDDFRRLRELLG